MFGFWRNQRWFYYKFLMKFHLSRPEICLYPCRPLNHMLITVLKSIETYWGKSGLSRSMLISGMFVSGVQCSPKHLFRTPSGLPIKIQHSRRFRDYFDSDKASLHHHNKWVSGEGRPVQYFAVHWSLITRKLNNFSLVHPGRLL